MSGWDSPIRVVHVDDNEEIATLTAEYLQREDDRFEVVTATSAAEGLSILDDESVDCVVSDYDMPGRTGIEFLEVVRERDRDLPFVLYTGKGGEEVASRAISAGVTDYLQKETGPDQYTILANRIGNAVERYRAKEVVERSERRLRKVIDRLPHPVFVIDTDEQYQLSNEAHARVHDTTVDDIEGTPAAEVLDERFYEQFRADLETVLETGDPVHKPDVVDDGADPPRYYDSRIYPFDSFRRETGAVLGIVIDITERKRREQTLEGLHRVTRQLVGAEDETAVASLVVDAVGETLGYRTNVVRFVSDGTAALRPVAKSDTAEDLMGERPVSDVGEGPAGRAYAASETVVCDDLREVDDGYDRGPVRSGMFVPIEGHGVLSIGETDAGVFDEWDVNVAEMVAASAAVALDQIEETHAREHERDRMEEFAGIVSHDLRTPLSTLAASLDLAERDGAPAQFDRCRRAVDRMDSLAEDLLTLARQGHLVAETKPVGLAPLTVEAWGEIPSGDATLDVETDQVVHADRRRLRQVLDNLLGNALDHADPDVTVTVGALEDRSGFFVADDGPGIPPEKRGQVFEAGYSTSDDGTGYGLLVVRRIAEAHGWTVDLTETDAGGARFEVTGVEFAE